LDIIIWKKNFFKNLDVKILAFNLHLKLFLKKQNIPYYVDEEYIFDEESVKIDELALYFTINCGKNFFKFSSIDLSLIDF